MPIYEYICLNCQKKFEAIRRMDEADLAIKCPVCDSDEASRTIAVFYAKSGGKVIAGNDKSCSSCNLTSCSTCGQ